MPPAPTLLLLLPLPLLASSASTLQYPQVFPHAQAILGSQSQRPWDLRSRHSPSLARSRQGAEEEEDGGWTYKKKKKK